MTSTWEGTHHRMLGTEVHLLVTDPAALPDADLLLVRLLAQVDQAASRFRPDSELLRLQGWRRRVSPLLADLLRAALGVAAATDGLVDPTLGRQLCEAGYNATFDALPSDRPASTWLPRPGCWAEVVLDDDVVEVPAGVLLDLGATAKAWAADTAARRIVAALGAGVLVNLGGDISVQGPAPAGGWPVAVADRPGAAPVHTVAVSEGGVATSSTTARVWRRGGLATHHLLDPRTGAAAPSDWRAVTVAAGSCLQANALSTAAVVLGAAAPAWLTARGAPALLHGSDGCLVRTGGWP